MGRGASGLKKGSGGGGGGTTSPYNGLLSQLSGVTNNLRRKFIIQRSDQYIGDSGVRNALFGAITPPSGYSIQSIDSFSFDSNPDQNGVAKVYVRYTAGKSRFTGGVSLGSGRRVMSTSTKSGAGVFSIKILK